VQRYVERKAASKEQRNQHMADAFYQGGCGQTAIALVFASTSWVGRIVAGYARGAVS
jgi:hypothetical protein